MTMGTALQAINVTHPQAKYLAFVFAHNNCEIDFDLSRYRPDAAAMVRDLIVKGLLVVREYVTHALQAKPDRTVIALTDKGKAWCEAYENALSKSTTVAAAPTAVAT